MSDYTTHPEWRALLAAIRADPTDDLPRLVAADWLEEHGQVEWATWLRHEVLNPEEEPRWFPPGEPVEFDLVPAKHGGVQAARLRLASGWPGVWCSTHRGFVFQLSGSVTRLAEVLPAVVTEHPLRWSVATDREPWRESSTGLYVWRRPTPGVPDATDRLPDHVFDMLNPDRGVSRSYHQSTGEAVVALSDALIAWALAQSAQVP